LIIAIKTQQPEKYSSISSSQNYLSDAIVVQEAEIEISSAISLLYAVLSPQSSRELKLRFLGTLRVSRENRYFASIFVTLK